MQWTVSVPTGQCASFYDWVNHPFPKHQLTCTPGPATFSAKVANHGCASSDAYPFNCYVGGGCNGNTPNECGGMYTHTVVINYGCNPCYPIPD